MDLKFLFHGYNHQPIGKNMMNITLSQVRSLLRGHENTKTTI